MKTVIRGELAQPSLKFYNSHTNALQSEIWPELQDGLWKHVIIDNFIYNGGGVPLLDRKAIFPSIHPIYPGLEWDNQHKRYVEKRYYPKYYVDATLSDLLQRVEVYFDKYRHRKIGVHLSGGLDSSLIICLLHYFNIPCTLIGFSVNRFEFRTERAIQEKLMKYGAYSQLVDFELYPPYSKLSNTPKHQIPDFCIKQNEASKALARAFAQQKVDVVFTGQGGDSLFVDAIEPEKTSFNIGNEFSFPWEQDLIYSPLGIELVSFFSEPSIMDAICSMRLGQKSDPLKIWARKAFREFLPFELSDYAYCADFFGTSMSGLEAAKSEIRILCEEAYDTTKHPIFNSKEVKEILSIDVFSLEYKTYCALCSKISMAIWLHSLFKEDENK